MIGRSPAVRHRQQPHPDAPRLADLVGDGRRRGALGQPSGAVEVGGEVAVAEVEPRRRRARAGRADRGVAPETLHRLPRLAGQAPAPLGVDRPGQRVGDRVEVGRDRQAVEHGVVAGVDDRRDVGRRHDVEQPTQEAGGADPAAHDGDLQACEVVARVGHRPSMADGASIASCRPRRPSGGSCRARSSPGSRARTVSTWPSSCMVRATTCSGWSRGRATRRRRRWWRRCRSSSSCPVTSPTCRRWSRRWRWRSPTRCTTSVRSASSPCRSRRPS